MKRCHSLLILSTVLCCMAGCEDSSLECIDDTTQCSNHQVQVCQNGKWTAPVDCENNQICDSSINKCIARNCEENTTQCTHGKVQTCQNGKWTAPVDCEAGNICDSNHNKCVQKVCDEGELKCGDAENENANALYICDNNAWTEHIPCSEDQICGTTTQPQCITRTCKEDEKHCGNVQNGEIENTLYHCVDNKWVRNNCSDNNQICDSNHNKCVEKVCDEGDIKCGDAENENANALYICDNNAWTLISQCNEAQVCGTNAEGKSDCYKSCDPANKEDSNLCVGQNRYECKPINETATETSSPDYTYALEEECQGNTPVCAFVQESGESPKVPKCVQCEPRTVVCSSNNDAVRKCNDKGEWEDTVCENGSLCGKYNENAELSCIYCKDFDATCRNDGVLMSCKEGWPSFNNCLETNRACGLSNDQNILGCHDLKDVKVDSICKDESKSCNDGIYTFCEDSKVKRNNCFDQFADTCASQDDDLKTFKAQFDQLPQSEKDKITNAISTCKDDGCQLKFIKVIHENSYKTEYTKFTQYHCGQQPCYIRYSNYSYDTFDYIDEERYIVKSYYDLNQILIYINNIGINDIYLEKYDFIPKYENNKYFYYTPDGTRNLFKVFAIENNEVKELYISENRFSILTCTNGKID